MSLGQTYVLLLASLLLFVYGTWQAHRGWAQKAEAARRSRLEQGEPASRRLQSGLDAALRRNPTGRSLDLRLAAAGMSIGPSGFLAVLVATVLAAWVLVNLVAGPVLAVVAAAAAGFGCIRYVRFRQDRRREEFVGQLPEVARLMSNASSAGLALPRAIELAASEMPAPAGEILQRIVDELRVGQSVDVALENLERRMASREVSVLVSTLVIQQRAGGDVVRALRDMAETLEARKDLRREVRTVMTGAISTGWVVGGLGVGSLLLVNSLSPGLLEQMTRNNVGRIALLTAGALYTVAFLLVRRTTRIET